MADVEPGRRPSRSEFAVQRKRALRVVQVGNVVAIVVGFAGFLLATAAFAVLGRPKDEWFAPSGVGGLALTAATALGIKRYCSHRYGAICPQCRTSLVDILGAIAVASGRCGKCGAIVCE